MTTYLIFVYLISSGFLDPQNMDLDTKTNVIRQLEAELWKLTISILGSHLNFEFLGGGDCWSGVVVPAIFGISIQKKNMSKFSYFLHKVHAPFTYLPYYCLGTSCGKIRYVMTRHGFSPPFVVMVMARVT